MKELYFTFIEEGLSEKELTNIVGGVMVDGCNTLKQCNNYSGDCNSLSKCITYSESGGIVGDNGPITTNPVRTGIIT